MNKVIIGIGVFLILVGIIGLATEIKVFSEVGGGGTAESGGSMVPNWLIGFLIYQALLPITLICTGGALIQIGKELSKIPNEKEPLSSNKKE